MAPRHRRHEGMKRAAAGLVLAALWCGCGGDGAPDGGDGGGGGGGGDLVVAPDLLPPGPPRTVTGARTRTWITRDGAHVSHYNLTDVPFAAHYERGDGSWYTIPGQGFEDSTFTINDVPAGPVVVQYRANFVETDADFVDFDSVDWGRFDGRTAQQPSPIDFEISGMTAWKGDDELFLYSENAGTDWDFVEDNGVPPPLDGDTALHMTADLLDANKPALVDAAKQDVATLLHLGATRDASNTIYRTPIESATLAPFTQADGMMVTVTGAFTPIPASKNINLRLPRSAYAQYRKAVHPLAAVRYGAIHLSAIPGGLQYGSYDSWLPLLWLFSDTQTTDLDLGAHSYGDPYPPSYGRFFNIEMRFGVSYKVDNAKPILRSAYILQVMDLATFDGSQLMPALSPPQSLQLDGADAGRDLLTTSLTPLLTWTAPALGTPSHYVLDIYQLTASSGVTTGTYVASLFTKRTRMRVPPDVLQHGKRYLVEARAVAMTGVDIAHTPFHSTFPYAAADALTGMITVR